MTNTRITGVAEVDQFLTAREPGLWRDPDFDLSDVLESCIQPFIEVGGPTPKGYQLIARPILRQLLVSNIKPEAVGTSWWRKTPKLDFIADAHALPFAANSIGAVFTSAFGDGPFITDESGEDIGYRAPMIDEAARVLCPNGLLVIQHGNIRNVRRMTDNNLIPRLIKVNKLKDHGNVPPLNENVLWSHTRSLFIFQKPESQTGL